MERHVDAGRDSSRRHHWAIINETHALPDGDARIGRPHPFDAGPVRRRLTAICEHAGLGQQTRRCKPSSLSGTGRRAILRSRGLFTSRRVPCPPGTTRMSIGGADSNV
ncbi:MAG: hypothetical protein M9890_06945 [Thermomicrobiales bacterium]|nr:hypothetical protein [Thermomicrobiales bacterium]